MSACMLAYEKCGSISRSKGERRKKALINLIMNRIPARTQPNATSGGKSHCISPIIKSGEEKKEERGREKRRRREEKEKGQ